MKVGQSLKSVLWAFRHGLLLLPFYPVLLGLGGAMGLLIYLEQATLQGTLLSGLNGTLIEALAPSGNRTLALFNREILKLSLSQATTPQIYVAGGSALDSFFQTATLPKREKMKLAGGLNFQFRTLINHGFSSSILSIIADNLANHQPSAILLAVSPYVFGKNPSYYVFNESSVILGHAPTLSESSTGYSINSLKFTDAWPRSLVFLGRLYTFWCKEWMPFKGMPPTGAPETVESIFLRNILPAFDRHFEKDKALFLRTLKVLQKKGIKVILLELPASKAFRRPRPDQVKKYEALANEFRKIPGVSYLDLLKHVPLADSDFSDGIHFTPQTSARLLPLTLRAIKTALEQQFELPVGRAITVASE